MPGSITNTTHAGDSSDWYCRFHFGTDPTSRDDITTKVRSILRERLGRAGGTPAEVVNAMRGEHRS